MRATEKTTDNALSPGRTTRSGLRPPVWTSSLRFRLAIWYGLVVGTILALFSVSLYFVARHALVQETDQLLAAVAHRLVVSARADSRADQVAQSVNSLSTALDASPINQDNLPPYLRHPVGFLDLAETSIRVVRATDRFPLAQSRNLSVQPDLQAALDKALNHATGTSAYQFTQVETPSGFGERVATRYSRSTNLFIQVSTPWDRDADLLSHLALLLCASVCVGIGLAALGGWMIVGRSLRPVDRLVREVETLGEEDFMEASTLASSEADGEIGRLVASFNHLVGRLSRSLDAQRRFAEDAAHELQTPATVLQLHLEKLLRRDRPAAEVRAAVEIALEEVGRIIRIVDALSYSARSDANTAPLDPGEAPVDLDMLIRNNLEHYRPLAARKEIVLRSEPCLETLMAAGDGEELSQVIRNLLDNAVKYTDPGGEIEISGTKQEANGRAVVVVTVADTGCGLTDEELPHVFERFWRSRRTKGMKGSGLGLTICERIVRRHGGTISVARRPGGGSVFSISLPAWTPDHSC